MKLQARKLPQTATIILALSAALQPAFAQFPPPETFSAKPSLDTTPITVKIAYVTYRIPRNYFVLLEPAIPTLKLTWPGLKPLTEDTRKCFGSILQSEQVGCTSFEFLMLGSRGPNPGGWALTNAQRFENFKSILKTPPRQGPLGYDIYDLGPEEARTEIYRRVEGDIYFRCMFSIVAGQKRGVVCDDMFRLDDMNHLRFRFRLQHIEYIAEIEAGMRKLMSGFVIERREPNDTDDPERRDSKRN